jgi:hypothetical protein
MCYVNSITTSAGVLKVARLANGIIAKLCERKIDRSNLKVKSVETLETSLDFVFKVGNVS